MSNNAEGWSRNRGRKCPVESGTLVDLQLRGGVIHIGKFCDNHTWIHTGEPFDVMYYRLHKPAEQVEPFIEAVHASNALSKVPQLDGPIGWRDRITEIDATTQALATERADLVQKLASEGFALIGRVVEPVEDMSDWLNWKVGDVVRYEGLPDFHSKYFTIGNLYEIKVVEAGDDCKNIYNPVIFKADDSGEESGWRPELFKFHSRPSA